MQLKLSAKAYCNKCIKCFNFYLFHSGALSEKKHASSRDILILHHRDLGGVFSPNE